MIELLQPARDELPTFLRNEQGRWRNYPVAPSALPPRIVLDEALRVPPDRARQYRWTAPFLIVYERTIVGSIGGKGLIDTEDEVELGYNVAAAYRRQGIATAAIRAVVDLLRYETIWPLAHVEPSNQGSRRALRHNGFVVEAIVRLPDSLDLERWRLPDQYDPPLEGLRVAL